MPKKSTTPKNPQPPSSRSPSTPCSQLFRVKVTYDTVIRAVSEDEAKREVRYGMGDIDDMPTSIQVGIITNAKNLPPGWDGKCRPWGQTDPHERTIEQILSANAKLRHGGENQNV